MVCCGLHFIRWVEHDKEGCAEQKLCLILLNVTLIKIKFNIANMIVWNSGVCLSGLEAKEFLISVSLKPEIKRGNLIISQVKEDHSDSEFS